MQVHLERQSRYLRLPPKRALVLLAALRYKWDIVWIFSQSPIDKQIHLHTDDPVLPVSLCVVMPLCRVLRDERELNRFR